MNRSDRLLLDSQIRNLDQMIRSMSDMRSVLVRRMRRLETPPLLQPPAVRQPPAVTQPPVVQVRISAKPKIKTLKKSEETVLLPDVCGICLDSHLKLDSITISCNHEFGELCFNQWKNTCQTAGKPVKCPICRIPASKYVKYRKRVVGPPRAKKSRTPTPAPEQEVVFIRRVIRTPDPVETIIREAEVVV